MISYFYFRIGGYFCQCPFLNFSSISLHFPHSTIFYDCSLTPNNGRLLGIFRGLSQFGPEPTFWTFEAKEPVAPKVLETMPF